MTDTTEYRFGPATKDPAEERKVFLDCFDLCANFWRPNTVYAPGAFVRPSTATGFAYSTAGGGLSAATEPRWPTTIGDQRQDGSVTWQCAVPASNGLNVVSGPSHAAPAGLTVTSVAVVDGTRIAATYSGGVEGQDYDVAFTFTINSIVQVGRQTVRVRRR
jgi:hypothetical protein